MLSGITSVGLVVRLEDRVVPDELLYFPDVVTVDCELVQPARATATQMRKITAIMHWLSYQMIRGCFICSLRSFGTLLRWARTGYSHSIQKTGKNMQGIPASWSLGSHDSQGKALILLLPIRRRGIPSGVAAFIVHETGNALLTLLKSSLVFHRPAVAVHGDACPVPDGQAGYPVGRSSGYSR